MLIKPQNPDALKSYLMERPIVLFGMGGMGQKITEYCNLNDIPIACFVDNSAEKQSGKTIISPKAMKENYADSNVIISSVIYFEEIKSQLEDFGFRAEQILSYKIFLPEGEITWRDLDKTADWERMKARVKQLSEWIDENVRSVVDYGAGEMYLKNLLPQEVKYFPIDYIRRSDETIICDLNSGIFPDISADVTILGGLLEFISTAESLICHVCINTKHKILASYMTTDNFPDIKGRRMSAYVNDFSEQQLVDMFARNHFVLKVRQPSHAHAIDTLFLFERG